jgi:hypothetical protein
MWLKVLRMLEDWQARKQGLRCGGRFLRFDQKHCVCVRSPEHSGWHDCGDDCCNNLWAPVLPEDYDPLYGPIPKELDRMK